jgi:RND superfamily putative drug exporter
VTSPESARVSRGSGGYPRRSGSETASGLRTGGIPGAVVRFRYIVLALWVIVLAVAIPAAVRVSDRLQVQGEGLKDAESQLADRRLRQQLERPVDDFFAVTIQGRAPLETPSYGALLDTLAAAAAAQPYITRVVTIHSTPDSALVSTDHRTTFFVAAVAIDLTDPTTRVPAFRKAIHDAHRRARMGDDFEVNVTGGPALDFDVRTVSKADAEHSEARAVPLSAVVLILAFGALVAAALPIVVGVFAITCAYALIHLASAFYPMSVFVLNIVSMVGLGVGIDYSLLVVTRFREELNRGLGAREAAARTISTAGLAVVTSGLTVIVGFAALFVVPLNETRSVAIGGLLVVGGAVLLAVTFLPALLAVLGRSVDLPKWLARRLAWYHAPTTWERWARWLSHHPYRAIVIGGVLVGAITWPLAGIKIGLPRAGWFPSATESGAGVRALEAMGARGALQPIRVVVQVPEGERVVSSRYLRALRRLSDSVRADPRVSRIRSIVDLRPGTSLLQYSIMYSDLAATRTRSPDFYAAYLSPDARTTVVDALLADSTSFTSAMDVVRRVRSMASKVASGRDTAQVLVGGFAAASVDLQDELLGRFPLLVAVILLATAVMMFVAFRSVLVPIKAVVMNCLSVGGAFGLIVLVFQRGFGARLFGLDGPTEAVYVVVPVLVFATVFGLSMDYEVFLLSRIKESFDRTGRNNQATMEGLSATASTITSAAAIMIIVFGAASFSRVLAVQLMGFGLAVAVFLDATLIRMVLVPAIMHLAGRWNWWPGVSASDEDEVT